jgi:hypothetical protein
VAKSINKNAGTEWGIEWMHGEDEMDTLLTNQRNEIGDTAEEERDT